MKKNLIIIILVIILIVCFFGIGIYFYNNKEKKITDFYHNDAIRIESIQIINGNNGNIINVSKTDDLNIITNYLNSLRFSKMPSSQYTGWQYRYIIDSEGTNVTIEFSGDKCKINGVQYKITKNDESIGDIYNKLLK